MLSRFMTLLVGLTVLAAASVHADDHPRARKSPLRSMPAKGDSEQADIVVTAASTGNFRTLINALVATDLVGALKGDSGFTVFAPTDEAFGKLPKDAVAALLKPANREALTALLKFHVVPGKLTAKALRKASTATSLNGATLAFEGDGHGLKVEGANIIKADILCANGIIHVIDSVLMPQKRDLLAVAEKQGQFKVLLAAVKAAGLTEALQGDGPFTILAPTDEAFSKIPPETLKSLLKPENKSKLAAILKYHVIPTQAKARDVAAMDRVKTLNGEVEPKIIDGRLQINDAKVIATDIKTDNGIIHVIDSVLMPR